MRRSPFLLVILFVIAAALHAQTGIPRMFNYQGVLTTATGDWTTNSLRFGIAVRYAILRPARATLQTNIGDEP